MEKCGHALFDLRPQLRGNLFNDEVYRLAKAPDATTTFFAPRSKAATEGKEGRGGAPSPLPPHHRFSRNDVVVLTKQPRGAGDFLSASSLPTAPDAARLEARVLSVGPAYVDVAVPAGRFAAALGSPQDERGRTDDAALRLRADRFFSDVPFRRMTAALGQLTAVPPPTSEANDDRASGFQMDAVLKNMVLSTFPVEEGEPHLGDLVCRSLPLSDIESLQRCLSRTVVSFPQPKQLAKPPLPTSHQLTNQVMSFIQTNPLFPQHNEPQLTAIQAALTRKCTLIQGPPGTWALFSMTN